LCQRPTNDIFFGFVSSYENIISRTCYYAWYVLTRRIDSHYPDVQKKVLNSGVVQSAVHQAAQDEYKQLNGSSPGKSTLSGLVPFG